MKLRISLLVFGSIGAVALAQTAGAQTAGAQTATPAATDAASPAPAPAADPSGGVAEIVVTAQKRSENLQKVPISITALTSAALEQRGINGLANFTTSPVVGLQVTAFAGDSSTLLVETRGVSSLDAGQGTFEPGTGIYIDDVYVARAKGLGSDLVDPERIEVLRGPQGTLFGRNSEGGAVRIVTKKPTGVFGGNASVTYGNYNRQRYEAHLDLPTIAGFKIKLDYINDKRNDYTTNGTARNPLLASQAGFGGEKGEGYRGAVRWEPLAGLTVDYAYDHVKTTADNDYWELNAALVPGRPVDSLHARDQSSFVSAYAAPFVTTAQSHTLTVAYKLSSDIALKSITGFRKSNSVGAPNLFGTFESVIPVMFLQASGSPVLAGDTLVPTLGTTSTGLAPGTTVYGVSGVVPYANVRQHQFSQELQLVGTTGDFQYTLGAYYFNETANDQRESAYSIAYTDPYFTQVVGLNAFLVPYIAGVPASGGGLTGQTAKARSYAGFAQVTWSPGFADGRLHVTGGIRYTNDRKDFLRYLTSGQPTATVGAPFSASRFDPAFTLAYDITPRINVYAKYSQAYRAGGVSVRSPSFRPFGAETNKALEAGLKSDLLDRHLRVNAAVYREKLRNVQDIVQLNPLDPGSSDTINTPGYTLWGTELEVTAVPTEGLNLSAAYAYQHGPGAYRVALQDVNQNANYYVQSFPTHTLSLSGDWQLPKQDYGQFVVHVDYSLASKDVGTPRIPDGAHTSLVDRNVANARLTLQEIPAGPVKLKLAGFVNNVFNTIYPVSTGPGFAGVLGAPFIPAPPRTYGVVAGVSF